MKDLEPFHPDRMASRIIGMGDVMTLIEKAEQAMDVGTAEEMARALAEGEFTLEDFRDQLRSIKKMGPLSSIMEMIPGFGAAPGAKDIDDDALKSTEAILDSMTPDERLRPSIINGSRKRRIAKGSGTHVQEINRLLKQHAQMRKMMKNMMRQGRKGRGLRGFPFGR